MSSSNLPQPSRPSLPRRALQQAELVRYWWEYRGRLQDFLRHVDPANAVRLTGSERSQVRAHWRKHGISYLNLDWFRLYKALTGVVDPCWVPEETFRTRIEPYLCRRDVSAAYHDKNQMDRLFADLRRPRTILRNIYGNYFDGAYRPIDREEVLGLTARHAGFHFLKPAISGTGGGHNVTRVECLPDGFRVGDVTLGLAEIERTYVQDFLVQEAVTQHAWYARFHPESLNTVRMITLRLHGRLVPIAATLRMGNGKPVDNGHAGGLLCGVSVEDGAVTPFACDVHFKKFDRHPYSGQVFANQRVPSIGAMIDLALEVHSRLNYFDMVSCDLAVTEGGAALLVEANTFGQGIEPHQFLQGKPLFGAHTEDVLALVAKRARGGWNP